MSDPVFKPVPIDADEEIKITGIIKKGENGFIWLPTDNGLCRFDGKRFKFYSFDPKDPFSIFSNVVYTVLPIGDKVWVGTAQGISILDVNKHQFKHYQIGLSGKLDSISNRTDMRVNTLFQDRQGDIWVGTRDNGLWKYEKEEDDFTLYKSDNYTPLKPLLYTHERILSIEQSMTNDSIIWGGTASGLLEVNKFSGQARSYTYPRKDPNYQANFNVFLRIYHHTDGLLYVGNWRTGVSVFNPKDKTLVPVEVKNDSLQILQKGVIYHFLKKSKDEIWISTSNGLILYSCQEKKILELKLNELEGNRFYGYSLIDENFRTWISKDNKLFLDDPYLKQFRTFSFEPHLEHVRTTFAFLVDKKLDQGKLTICPGYTVGLYQFDLENREWSIIPFKNLAEFSDDEQTITFAEMTNLGNDDFLFSGEPGVFSFNLKEKMLKPIFDRPELKNILWNKHFLDSEGQLWLSSRISGLFRFNSATGEYQNFRKELAITDTVSSFTEDFFEDSRYNIWIKRAGGFSVYVRKKEQFFNFLFSKTPEKSFPLIDAFAEDQSGRLWTCSNRGWIGYIDVRQPEKGIIKKINIHDYGAKGICHRLVSDSKGQVWGYTNKELFRLNEEGLPGFIFPLKYSGQLIECFDIEFLPDDQMVIGGRKDITFVYPEKLKPNEELPIPYITQISVKQKPLEGGFPLSGGNALRLNHKENFFSIAYAAKAYTFGENVQFKYRLDGLEDWIDAEKRLVANYTSVPPGTYTFQLMAANNAGLWNEKILEIPIIIKQAWYKSWWFLSILGLSIAFLVYRFVRFRIRKVRSEEKQKANYEKKLAGVEMSALVAQMNPHFLFNSLNSIDSFIIKNESVKASEYLNNFARLMRLVLHKSRANYTNLNDEIETLELYLQMEKMRFNDLFSYDIQIAPTVDVHQIEVPPMLIQPYLENAIWHGLMHLEEGNEGKVMLSFSMEEQKLKILIQDNGIGRKRSAELRKHKTNPHKESMGMKITKNRIEMINKLYNADASVIITDLYDEQGQASGTKVILTIAI